MEMFCVYCGITTHFRVMQGLVECLCCHRCNCSLCREQNISIITTQSDLDDDNDDPEELL